MSNDFTFFGFGLSFGSSPSGLASGRPDCPTPSLRLHYRAFIATTSRSAPVPRIGTLRLGVSLPWRPPSR